MTGDLLKSLFLPDSGFASKDKTVSHVAVLKPEKYSKLLMVTDGAVNIAAGPENQTRADRQPGAGGKLDRRDQPAHCASGGG